MGYGYILQALELPYIDTSYARCWNYIRIGADVNIADCFQGDS